MRIEIGRGEKEKEKRKEICPFNEEEIVDRCFSNESFYRGDKGIWRNVERQRSTDRWRSAHKGKVIQLLTDQPRNRIATVLFLRCCPIVLSRFLFESLQKLWLRVSIFKTTNETNAKLPSRKRIRDIKTYSDCQQRTDPNKTVISPHLECVLPRKILETDRGKSILKNLASSLSIIIQSDVESKLLRRPIIVPLPFFPSEMNQ